MVGRIVTSGGRRIYRIKCQVLPHLSGYVHLLLGTENAPTLVDAGSGENECPEQIRKGFEIVRQEFEPDFRPESIQRIVLTHTHIDHFGGAHDLRRLTGAEIWVHELEARSVCSFNERAAVSNCHFSTFLRECGIAEEMLEPVLRMFGFVAGRTESSPVARTLVGGEEFDGIRVFHFSGHSPGHIALLVDDCILVGDQILSSTLTQIWPESLVPHTGLAHYLESLDRLETLAVQWKREHGGHLTAIPSHEDIIMDIPRRVALVRKGTEHRNNRIMEILSRYEPPMTADEIARKMYLTAHAGRTVFALCDIGSRLEYLQQKGKIAVANYSEFSLTDTPVLRYCNC